MNTLIKCNNDIKRMHDALETYSKLEPKNSLFIDGSKIADPEITKEYYRDNFSTNNTNIITPVFVSEEEKQSLLDNLSHKLTRPGSDISNIYLSEFLTDCRFDFHQLRERLETVWDSYEYWQALYRFGVELNVACYKNPLENVMRGHKIGDCSITEAVKRFISQTVLQYSLSNIRGPFWLLKKNKVFHDRLQDIKLRIQKEEYGDSYAAYSLMSDWDFFIFYKEPVEEFFNFLNELGTLTNDEKAAVKSLEDYASVAQLLQPDYDDNDYVERTFALGFYLFFLIREQEIHSEHFKCFKNHFSSGHYTQIVINNIDQLPLEYLEFLVEKTSQGLVKSLTGYFSDSLNNYINGGVECYLKYFFDKQDVQLIDTTSNTPPKKVNRQIVTDKDGNDAQVEHIFNMIKSTHHKSKKSVKVVGQSREKLRSLCDLLKENDIPYNSRDIAIVPKHPLAKLVQMVARILCDHEKKDLEAWIYVFRSPLVAFTQQDLELFRLPNFLKHVDEVCNLTFMPDEVRIKANNCVNISHIFGNSVGLYPNSVLVEMALNKLGLRVLISNQEEDDIIKMALSVLDGMLINKISIIDAFNHKTFDCNHDDARIYIEPLDSLSQHVADIGYCVDFSDWVNPGRECLALSFKTLHPLVIHAESTQICLSRLCTYRVESAQRWLGSNVGKQLNLYDYNPDTVIENIINYVDLDAFELSVNYDEDAIPPTPEIPDAIVVGKPKVADSQLKKTGRTRLWYHTSGSIDVVISNRMGWHTLMYEYPMSYNMNLKNQLIPLAAAIDDWRLLVAPFEQQWVPYTSKPILYEYNRTGFEDTMEFSDALAALYNKTYAMEYDGSFDFEFECSFKLVLEKDNDGSDKVSFDFKSNNKVTRYTYAEAVSLLDKPSEPIVDYDSNYYTDQYLEIDPFV